MNKFWPKFPLLVSSTGRAATFGSGGPCSNFFTIFQLIYDTFRPLVAKSCMKYALDNG